MHDRNPVKLLLCARDVLTGLVKPWHVGRDHIAALDTMRDRIDEAVNADVDAARVYDIINECVALCVSVAIDAAGSNLIYDKLDRARRIMQCICNEASNDKIVK